MRRVWNYQKTLVGVILSLSCQPNAAGEVEFFQNPSRRSQQEHRATQQYVWQVGRGIIC